jgi:hypothetical protein
VGYDTRADGTITISPPLAFHEIKDDPYLPTVASSAEGGWRDVEYVVDETTVDTDMGRLTTFPAAGVRPTNEGQPWTRYALLEQLQDVVNRHPGHQFGGHIECSGPEGGPPWRIVVRDRKVVEIHPTLIWPGDVEPEADRLRRVIAEVEALTVNTDGDPTDDDFEIPVGEIRRALHEHDDQED